MAESFSAGLRKRTSTRPSWLKEITSLTGRSETVGPMRKAPWRLAGVGPGGVGVAAGAGASVGAASVSWMGSWAAALPGLDMRVSAAMTARASAVSMSSRGMDAVMDAIGMFSLV